MKTIKNFLRIRNPQTGAFEGLPGVMSASSMYPVGSIYMSVLDVDPATLFGGKWEKIKDTFLLSAGDTYSVGDTGGESEHTLTVDEMPAHNHGIKAVAKAAALSNDKFHITPSGSTDDSVITETGGGLPHNNMPPYLVVNVWKRTE